MEHIHTYHHTEFKESEMKRIKKITLVGNIRQNDQCVGKSRQRGQGMSEYLIIVALIAVAAIGVVGFMGDTVSNQMASMAMEISGQNGGTATTAAQGQATAAATNAATGKTMANFATAN